MLGLLLPTFLQHSFGVCQHSVAANDILKMHHDVGDVLRSGLLQFDGLLLGSIGSHPVLAGTLVDAGLLRLIVRLFSLEALDHILHHLGSFVLIRWHELVVIFLT